mgnify:CR=1 FL=1
MPTEPPTPPPPPPDLADVIRQVSEGFKRLKASGLNRRAVVVLLADSTGLGKKAVEKVLDGLDTLAKDYTTNKGKP